MYLIGLKIAQLQVWKWGSSKSEVKFKKNLSCQKQKRAFENITLFSPVACATKSAHPCVIYSPIPFIVKTNIGGTQGQTLFSLFLGQSTLLASLPVLLSYQIWTEVWKSEGSWHLRGRAAALPPCSKSLCIPSMALAGISCIIVLWCMAWAGQGVWCVMGLMCPACTLPATSAGELQAALWAAGKGLSVTAASGLVIGMGRLLAWVESQNH